jgi:hypothetical protein
MHARIHPKPAEALDTWNAAAPPATKAASFDALLKSEAHRVVKDALLALRHDGHMFHQVSGERRAYTHTHTHTHTHTRTHTHTYTHARACTHTYTHTHTHTHTLIGLGGARGKPSDFSRLRLCGQGEGNEVQMQGEPKPLVFPSMIPQHADRPCDQGAFNVAEVVHSCPTANIEHHIRCLLPPRRTCVLPAVAAQAAWS